VDKVLGADLGIDLADPLQVLVEVGVVEREVLHDLGRDREYLAPLRKEVLDKQVKVHGQVVDELALTPLCLEAELEGQQPKDVVGFVVARVRVQHIQDLHCLS